LYQGGAVEMNLWEDYIMAQISMSFEKLKEIDRLRVWLQTTQGREWIIFKFDTLVGLEYLNLKQISKEVDYDEHEVCWHVYDLVIRSASNKWLDE
jgi:hypothetical protein